MTEQAPNQNQAAPLPGQGQAWYALYVRSRHEFSVFDHLTAARIEAFLPTVVRLRRWKDRKKLVTFPLFPGYLFVHIAGCKKAFLQVLKMPGAVKLLSARPGPPEAVPEEQIASLKTLVAGGQEIEPYPYLKEGNRVRIKWGPLVGLEGILTGRRGQHVLVLSIDILQQGASVRVDAADVEPV